MKVLMGVLKRARAWPRASVWSLALILFVPSAGAQTPNTELPQAPVPNVGNFPGGVVVERPTPGALPLSLDEAIARGEKHNLQMLLVIQNERMVRGEMLTVENSLLPSLTAKGDLEAQQINLAALGFNGSTVAEFGINPATIAT